MHDIWNPWHGCVKISEGCANCYMYFLDKQRDKNGADIYKTKTNFKYPIQKDRKGNYKIQSGERIRVCMTSDFFLEEADQWRDEAWDVMRQRPDVKFFLLTKRPQRVMQCLPVDWGNGWSNITFNVSCENQRRADERIPILLDLPFQHKGILCAPLIGPVSVEKYLTDGQIERIMCAGENYDGCRPCDFDWVKTLWAEAVAHDTTFSFIETGTNFVYNGKSYYMPNKEIQRQQAFLSGLQHQGREIQFDLRYPDGTPIPDDMLYKPVFKARCDICGSRSRCNGCSNCGKCD